MKIIQIHKEDESEEEISYERALEIITHHYDNPKEVLDNNNEINTTFCIIKKI